MDATQARPGLRLSYLHEPSKTEAFDPCRILDDLCDQDIAVAMLPRRNGLRISESDHLVLATGSRSGRCLGAIAASELATEREPFLFLDAAYLPPEPDASRLLRRMLAFAMLRIAGDASVPTLVAACVQTAWYANSLRDFGESFAAASVFPSAPDVVVIDLGMASLARRIVRVVRPASRGMAAAGALRSAALGSNAGYRIGSQSTEETLIVIDLSAADEATILNQARRLYRRRHSQGPRRDFADGIGNAASGGQRRLRDAARL